MEDCIFCKIIRGEIPAYKVYEDEIFLAFLDIAPINPGHTLLITKEHYDNFLALPEELAMKAAAALKKIAPAVIKAVETNDFNLGLNNGSGAGQAVGHVHWHIMPRRDGDGHKLFTGTPYAAGEAESILEKIRINLK